MFAPLNYSKTAALNKQLNWVMAAATLSSSSANIRMRCSRDEVYVGAVPLRATKGPAQSIMSTAYSLNFWDLQHFIVILKPSYPLSLSHQVLVYDFQPQDPESIWVAVAALSGRKVSGVILTRELRKLPKRKCWFVGYSKENAIDAAHEFNENWDTDLRIGRHDCRDYCQGLVEYLTGEKDVLQHLRESGNSTPYR